MKDQDNDDDSQKEDTYSHDQLVDWVMSNVNKWRDHRDSNYLKRWTEYYRLWRGFWDPTDVNRESERSRLIAPALSQAIDMTVSEMEEATFGRGVWFDISDDYEDQDKQDIVHLRDQLLCDFEEQMVPAAVSESFLSGALYGTGIGKIQIGKYIKREVIAGELQETDGFKVWLEPVSPFNFVVDPGARSVDDGLGCAHEMGVPKHKIDKKMETGFYYDKGVGTWDGQHQGFSEMGQTLSRDADRSDLVFITEYHGLVPKYMMDGLDNEDGEEDEPEDFAKFGKQHEDGEDPLERDEGPMVEAIVTIANKGFLLKAVENPYLMKDRAFVAYQHDTVPGRFWGRGVSEKGYNPQKALDAELRARIDALAYLTYPTMGADINRLPKGLDLKIKPGRLFLTNGRPSEILEPIQFGNLNAATFQQSGDLERMVQMGTGAMDSASPIEANRRNETMGGMSMIQGGFIKRSKRTMQNVERNFLDKIVQKAMWRYMQFDPERYPFDIKFQVNSTMGIMAREFEQATLTQMLQVVPPDSPMFPVVIKGIIENSATANKSELLDAINKYLQPPDQQAQQMQQQMQQLQMRGAMAEVAEKEAKAQLAQAKTKEAMANTQLKMVQASMEDEKIEIQAANTVLGNKKIEAQMFQTKIQAAVANKEMQHDELRMQHEMKMSERELNQKDEEHQMKMSHKEEEHTLGMKHKEQQAKQKAQQQKAKPKPKKK